MAPNTTSNLVTEHSLKLLEDKNKKYEWNIVWHNVLLLTYLHISIVYGLYLAFFQAQWKTLLFAFFLHVFGGLGLTIGLHRLWSHKSYKANLPARILLMLSVTSCHQMDIITWVKNHRLHHLYSEKDADPHNVKRGLFFAHVGWLLIRKHPEVIKKGKQIDMSDIFNDPVAVFQRKYYNILVPLLTFIIPSYLPTYWGESLNISYHVCGLLRYAILLHLTWFVNSGGHSWGYRPYNKNIGASENIITLLTTGGEGHHNYHHCFPWDYRSSEPGDYFFMNAGKLLIELMAKIGWASDLKTTPQELVDARCRATGDGTRTKKNNF